MKQIQFSIFDKIFYAAFIIYFFLSAVSIYLVLLALFWYIQSTFPILDWKDPDGPGFRVLEITPNYVAVRWIELQKLLDCPGHTTLSLVGKNMSVHLTDYPMVLETHRMSFIRKYTLPEGIPDGDYYIKITDTVRCNPLFENIQILRVPFELKRSYHKNS